MLTNNLIYFQAIPDTKLTIKKYADAKFEYLVCMRIYVYFYVSLNIFPFVLLLNKLHWRSPNFVIA